jgi:hypothetical protein
MHEGLSRQIEDKLGLDDGIAAAAHDDDDPTGGLADLPDAALWQIFEQLSGQDKYSLFCSSKRVRELFGQTVWPQVSIRLPGDDEYARGFSRWE